MEVRRAMFLQAWNHNLEKIAYPLGFRAALGGFLVGCIELGMKRTGNEWFFKMVGSKSKHIELTEESGRNRDICRRSSRNQRQGTAELTVR